MVLLDTPAARLLGTRLLREAVRKAGRCSNAAGTSLGVVLSTSLIIFPLIIHLAEQQVE